MRFPLVPEGYVRVIVGESVGVAVFNRYPDGFLKVDWIVDKKPIHGVGSIIYPPIIVSYDMESGIRPVILDCRRCATAKNFLSASSMDGWRPFFAVDEDHVITFTPPASSDVVDGKYVACKIAFTFRLEDHVVFLSIQVYLLSVLGRIYGLSWVFPAPLGVKSA